jgi:hypothetical protein
MQNFETIGRILLVAGIIVAGIGGLLILAKHIPFVGKLPGDILIEKKNFTFFFPITTSIVISILLSLVLYLFNKR